MHVSTKRAVITIAATVIAAACGSLAGYELGRALVFREVENKLDQYAARILTEGETSATEARGLLATVNASPYPYCSDAEIAWMRQLIFQSEYLKDSGHMRDGRIDCSAALSRLDLPAEQFKPDFTRQDGTRVYLDLPPFRVGNYRVVTLQQGDAFTVYSPYNLKDLGSAYMHFTVSDVDTSSGQTLRLVGELTRAQAWILTTEGRAREGNSLYATRCSTRYKSCMTAFTSIPEALRSERGDFTAYIAMGGFCGALFGFACSLVYRRNQSMEQQLRRAIRKGLLRVVYQPIVSLPSRKIVGAEALARWSDDNNFAVAPEVFVKIAEERGFVGAITRLMVRDVLRECGATLRSRPGFRVNVNVAAADLSDPQFLPMMEQALNEAGIAPQSLGIEITESDTARLQVARNAILHLQRRGHLVFIDDFGTGYSSLAYLHDLSVDGIKIDRAFTRAIGTESVTVSIIPQILAMAAVLNLQVTVEGIETAEQADYFATSEQPIFAQGWPFGRPVPVGEFNKLLAEEDNITASGQKAN